MIAFQDYVTDQTGRAIEQVFANPELAGAMTGYNYAVAQAHYSYRALERQLHTLLDDLVRTRQGTNAVLHVTALAEA